MKKVPIKTILVIASILGNIILISEILKVNQIDKSATENNLMMYINHFELLTLHMGEVLKDADNNESAYYVSSEAEFLREFSTVPMNNYYGQKKKELSEHVIILANQVNEVVLEYFVFQNVENLSTTKNDQLQEIHRNFQEITELFSSNLRETIKNGNSDSFLPRENELIELINAVVKINKKILDSME